MDWARIAPSSWRGYAALQTSLVALTLLCSTTGRAAYTITDLGTLGGASSRAYGLNDAGQVVGNSDVPGIANGRAFLYSNGVMTDLGSLVDGRGSTAYDINNNGQIVGFSYVSATNTHGFLYSGGVMTDMVDPTGLGSNNAIARAINDAGQIVGESFTRLGSIQAFRYKDGVYRLLITQVIASRGYGINASGQGVGDFLLSGSGTRAFVANGDPGTDLGAFFGAGTTSVANGINASGQVVGYFLVGISGDPLRAFLYSGGSMTILGSLSPGGSSSASSINDAGDVVGGSAGRGFLFSDGVMTDLNDLLPAGSGWTLAGATAINNVGQIVGTGVNPSGQIHAYLLSPVPVPVPEPSSLLLIGMGSVGALGLARRRRAAVPRSTDGDQSPPK
jgi:probable HAF family extracellular repeat protein